MSDSKFIFIICFIGLSSYQCLKLIPERAQLHYYDKQYVEYVSLNVRRAGRGGDYFVNVNFTLLQYLGNNVTISGYFYEYLNKEYKPSFIQLHYKLCDMILNDTFLGVIGRNAGLVTCPMVPGIYNFKNLYFNQEIPSVWPFEKGMLQVVAKHDAKPNGILVKADIMLTFANIVPAKRKCTKTRVVTGAGYA